jgi:hypothetical protein
MPQKVQPPKVPLLLLCRCLLFSLFEPLGAFPIKKLGPRQTIQVPTNQPNPSRCQPDEKADPIGWDQIERNPFYLTVFRMEYAELDRYSYFTSE